MGRLRGSVPIPRHPWTWRFLNDNRGLSARPKPPLINCTKSRPATLCAQELLHKVWISLYRNGHQYHSLGVQVLTLKERPTDVPKEHLPSKLRRKERQQVVCQQNCCGCSGFIFYSIHKDQKRQTGNSQKKLLGSKLLVPKKHGTIYLQWTPFVTTATNMCDCVCMFHEQV